MRGKTRKKIAFSMLTGKMSNQRISWELHLTLLVIGITSTLVELSLAEGSYAYDTNSSLPIGCFAEELNLALNLTGVGLKSLPEGFVENKYLTRLTLDDNQIMSVSTKTFSLAPNISHLSLANNKLTTLNLQPFSELDNLKTLILNGNCKSRSIADHSGYTRYVYIKTRLYDAENSCSLQFDANLTSLERLVAEENSLQRLSFSTGKLPSLKYLYLANNQLVMDPDTTIGLSRTAPILSHVYLNRSGIIDFEASHLQNMTALYLDDNEIRSICNQNCEAASLKLKQARKLETLSVARNQILKIEINAFNYTTNLTRLDLSGNRISEIREGTFDKLNNLQSLSLERNNIVKLGALHIFRGLSNLKTLSLGQNNISSLGAGAFENLIALETLTLDNNGLSKIESGTFTNLTNLKRISLAGNQLSVIPEGSMPTGGTLVILDLDNNKFTSVEHISITNAPRMLSLSLKDNPLTRMSSSWFATVPRNLDIVLGNSCYAELQNKSASHH